MSNNFHKTSLLKIQELETFATRKSTVFNFVYAVYYWISAVETVGYPTVRFFFSIYGFEKVCFPSEKAKLAPEN